MPVSITREGVKHPTRRLLEDARTLLKHLRLSQSELSLVLCDDAFIQTLNAQWRGKDEPTDVLSFAMGEGQAIGGASGLLGDIVVSVETAARQAAALGHPLEREMRVLLVHGLLHLRGFDHLTDADAAEMRAREAELLAVLGEPSVGLVRRAGEASAE